MSPGPVYLGIDLLARPRPFTYAALDSDCRLVAIGQGKLGDALAYLSGQSAARVAVNGPARPGLGLSAREDLREGLFPELANGQAPHLRLCELELEQRGIRSIHTPAEPSACPAWMKRGFSLYSYLDEFGYQPYPSEAERLYMEVQADACFWSLVNHAPYEHNTLEGRLQRQSILRAQSLPVPDPMEFLEEVTPYKLQQGMLPLEKIFSPYELNAWIAAYTALLTHLHPDRVTCLGSESSGVLVLPVKKEQSTD